MNSPLVPGVSRRAQYQGVEYDGFSTTSTLQTAERGMTCACSGGLLALAVKKKHVVNPNAFIHGISSVRTVSSLLGSWLWLAPIP